MCKKLINLVSFVLVLGLTTTVANADISDGLVAYWPLDEGAGTTTADLSGNGNDGTFVDAPAWVSGKFGGALDFDGSNDAVDCGNPPILDFGTGDFTISCWVNVGAQDNDEAIFGKGDRGGTCYFLKIRDDGSGDIKLRLDDGSTQLDPDTDDHAGLYTAPGWHHLVAMRRNPKIHVYVDGVDDQGVLGHGDSDIPAGYDLSNTSLYNAYIGAVEDTPLGRFFDGSIDDVAIWDRALTPDEIGYLWNNGIGNPIDVTPPGQASDPYPADEAEDVPRDTVLSWTPGEYAPAINGHKVYISENFNDVNDGVGGIAQSANSYVPGRLDFSTTYYWRVDEVNGAPDYTVYEGGLWSFTTEPVAYPIQNIIATASSSGAGRGPEKTIDGSGLDDSGLLHGKDGDDTMWLSDIAGPQPSWIEYEFDNVYKLHEMWVWNYNEYMEPVLGLGFKDVSIEYSVDGTDYTPLGTTAEFARAPGVPDYAHNTTVDFSGVTAKYVRLTVNSNWGGVLNQYGLSEVRFFYISVRAREPYPDSGATDVDVDVTLGFRAGREAAQHDVYVSTDEQAVIDGTAPVTTVTEASHGPLSLDLGKTYYWKTNEVNEAETPTTLDGEVWNFMTPEFLIVDDFEAYNDLNPDDPESNRIFNVWIDGYGDATNGSLVGYENLPFAEQNTVHSGEQAMPFFYGNTGGAAYSQAERTFAVPQNWTKAGIATLVLYFHGAGGNTGQLYAKINDSKVVYDGDVSDIATLRWKQWNIDLASVGVDLQNVTKLGIGIDGNGATGTLYVDDFRLYRLAPEPPLEIWFEAEAADSITEPMKIYPDAGVDPVKTAGGEGEPSGGLYIGTTSDVPGNNDDPGTQDIATYTFTVPAGTYAIWGRVSNVADDSLWVHIPDGQYDVPVHSSGWIRWNSIEPETADWHWVRVFSDDAPGSAVVNVTLTAGQHTILWAHRENQNFLDAFVITDKLD